MQISRSQKALSGAIKLRKLDGNYVNTIKGSLSTAPKCQKLMQEKLGEDMVLTEKQIKSYWSTYKRKKQLSYIYRS